MKTLAVDGSPAAFARAGDSVDVTLTDGADTVRKNPEPMNCEAPTYTNRYKLNLLGKCCPCGLPLRRSQTAT